jgi:asparagine synthase (glutamine-hydrolysing)
MCGILGAISLSRQLEYDLFSNSLQLIHYRGPDISCVKAFANDRCMLGHTRLKIIDLNDRSNQPMVSICGRYHIVFNGEIFNFRDLRALLPDHNWKTDGDTEVLLALYSRMGEKMLDLLNGMFAFAIFDELEGDIFAARDRFGIKPFYYADSSGKWIFSSEIPPLLKLIGSAKPDLATIKTYLFDGSYEIGTSTFFDGVSRLEAGCSIRVKIGNPSSQCIKRWYDVGSRFSVRADYNTADLQEELDHLLEKVIKRHLISDVPVGINVSGGVDSSLLIHYVSKFHPNIHGFTQDYAFPYSEREWVERATRDTSVNCNFIVQDAADCLMRFESVMRHQGEPFGGIPVIGFAPLYECANSLGVKVLLDGNGVDEIFLGYKKYHLADLAQKLGTPAYEPALAEYISFWEEPRSFIESNLEQNRYVGASIDGTIPVHIDAIGSSLQTVEVRMPLLPTSTGSLARDLAMRDLLATKMPRALRFNDRSSMMYGKELRVPFLDHELVEWGLSLPSHILMNHRGTKAPLRELLHRKVSPLLAKAPKRSVQSPQREWMGKEWRPFIESVLDSDSFRQRGWVCPARAKERYKKYLAGDNKNSFFIWQWISLEIWARQFLD